MSDANYEKLVGIIAKSSGVNREEIESRINAKRERISGLISKEGAAQIVAAELGVSFDNERLKINDLLPGMKKVNLVGKVINVSPVRTFTTKNGQEGKVVNLFVADDTSNIRVVIWDINHISLIENGKISTESSVEINNATMRDNELHLGSFSELKPSEENFGEVNTERITKEKNISEFRISDNVNFRAFIVQVFEPKFFDVCIDCKKKVVPEGESYTCQEHGKTANERRALLNVILDDGTETMRAVIFHDKLNSLGFSQIEPETLSLEKQNLLGKEMLFSGTVRLNKFFNNQELIIEDAKEISSDELLTKLEN